jgi:DNA-binding response OmpR family regulator
MRNILIVEDDKDFQDYLRELLVKNDYLVSVASTGVRALKIAKELEPSLVVLDLELPDMNGQGVCIELRKEFPSLPIIILTAKNAISEKIEGFNLGADDYITKPIIPEEFLARVHARLRRETDNKTVIKISDLELDNKKVEVKRAGKLINLTPHEFKLLQYLMSNKGIVLSRERILNQIWSYSYEVESRVVDVYMGYLRKKIDGGYKNKLIHTIRGFGYTIKA